MRRGEHIGTVETADANESMLTEMMVGKKVSLNIERSLPVDPAPRLEISHLNAKDQEGLPVLKDVTFTVNGGEILGIAGIAGSGQRELLEAIAGLQPLESGKIIFHNPKKDKPVSFFHKSYKRVYEMAAGGAFHFEDGTPVDVSKLNQTELVNLVQNEKVLFNEDEIMDLRDKTPL